MRIHHGILALLFVVPATATLAVPADEQKAKSAVPATADTATIAHVLNRLGYGPAPGDIEKVRAMSLATYIEQQLNPERIPDPALKARLAAYPSIELSTAEIARDYYGPAEQLRRQEQRAAAAAGATPGRPANRPPATGQTMTGDPTMAGDPAMAGAPPRPQDRNLSPELREARQKEQQIMQDLMQARMIRAVTSEHQLEEVLVDFWFNHFNVFVGKGQVRVYLTEYERDAIRPHVLGRFRDMLGAVAESPAMLFYLDNFQSVDPKATNRQADELEARMRQSDARRLLRGRGRGMALPPPNPQQQNQQTPAERIQQLRNRGLNENYARELMELHTLGVDGGYTQADVVAVARAFTGWTIDRPRDGGSFLFNAQMHDNDPKVVLGKTITAGGKRDGEQVLDLLAAHPSTATFIATKLARRFVADEPPASLVQRAAKVFLDTKGDLREVTRAIVTSPEFFSAEARQAKVKTPLEFVASAVRATGAEVNNPQQLVAALRTLGMPLYGAQPPTGWGDTAKDWINTGALLNRLNFALQLASGQLRGARFNVRTLAPNTSEASRTAVVDSLLLGVASEATRATLAKAESPQQLVALTLGSPEFQKR